MTGIPESRDLFRRAGAALFGPEWIPPLAEAMDINIRTVQRWASGKMPIPFGIWPIILDLIGAHALEAGAVAAEIYKLQERNSNDAT